MSKQKDDNNDVELKSMQSSQPVDQDSDYETDDDDSSDDADLQKTIGGPPTAVRSPDPKPKKVPLSTSENIDIKPAVSPAPKRPSKSGIRLSSLLHKDPDMQDEAFWELDELGDHPAPSKVPKEIRVEDAVGALQEKLRKRKVYKELGIYVIYIIVACLVIFLQRNVEQNFFLESSIDNNVLSQQFPPQYSTSQKNFYSIVQVNDVWQWLQGVFVPNAQVTSWYNGQPFNLQEQYTMQQYLRFLGGVRFKQVRVPSDSCKPTNYVSEVLTWCYSSYSGSVKDTKPFGPPSNPTKYKYSDNSVTDSPTLWGRVSGLYDGSGYVVDLPLDKNWTTAVQELYNDLWIDRGTRAVMITMNLFNPNTQNSLCVATIMLEFDEAGNVWPRRNFNTLRLDPYVEAVDYFRMFMELLLVAMVLYYLIKMMLEVIYATRRRILLRYIGDVWNILDFANLMIWLVVFVLQMVYLGSSARWDFDARSTGYLNFEKLAANYTQIFNLNAFNILLCFLKLFKFLRVHERMSVIWKAIGVAGPDLVAFIFCFMIVFLGFTFMGWLLFGVVLEDWYSFANAFLNCFQIFIGNADYFEMQSVNRVLAPIFFTLFIFMVYFTMANIFVAILTDAYSDVAEGAKGSKTIVEQLATMFRALVRKAKNLRGKNRNRRSTTMSDTKLLKVLQDMKNQSRTTINMDELGQIAPEYKEKMYRQIQNTVKQDAKLAANGDENTKKHIRQLNQRMMQLEKKLDSLIQILGGQASTATTTTTTTTSTK